PFVEVDAAQLEMLVGQPVSHVKGMRDDTRTGAQLMQQARAQLQIDSIQQIQGDNGGFGDVRREDIVFHEIDKVFHAHIACVLHGVGDTGRIDLDAYAARPEMPGGGHHDAPVAATEVVQYVAPTYAGK